MLVVNKLLILSLNTSKRDFNKSLSIYLFKQMTYHVGHMMEILTFSHLVHMLNEEKTHNLIWPLNY